MISVVDLWNQVQTLAKNGTTGYQTQDEFNSDLDIVQLQVANTLCDNYMVSEKIEDALVGNIKSSLATASSSGIVTFPTDFLRLMTLWLEKTVNTVVKKYPVNKIRNNQVSAYATAYVRKLDYSKNSVAYYFINDSIQMLPEQAMNVRIVYCRQPVEASIILTQSSTDDSDYVTPTSGADLQWSPILFNLFVYLMLERLGLEMKDNILFEFAQLGIPREAYIGTSIITQ